jgi:hypothetical protein
MNVIIFIIRVLKLLFMYTKYFFLAFVVIMAAASPAAGSLTKIYDGGPVYLGEQDLDISSGLQGCHVIDWWANGTDTTSPPSKNITIMKTVEDSNIAFHYSIDPKIYSAYTGTWYCEDKKPLRAVFEIVRPELAIRFWDEDKNEDITGKTVPLSSNITYRIDTNLDRALQYKYRHDITPQDSFYTVTLTDPLGNKLSTVYTGSYGKAEAHGIFFDSTPFISASPYFWKDGGTWDLESRNAQGEFLYPSGTYTLTVKQNLNHMETAYADLSPENRIGMLESSATVTLVKQESAAVTTVTSRATTPPGTVKNGTVKATPTGTLPVKPANATLPANRTPVPAKTTYAPLPSWMVPAALGLTGLFLIRKRG